LEVFTNELPVDISVVVLQHDTLCFHITVFTLRNLELVLVPRFCSNDVDDRNCFEADSVENSFHLFPWQELALFMLPDIKSDEQR
jgi:hypothetical protein